MRRITRRRVFMFVAVLLMLGAAIAEVVAERNPSGPPLSSRDSASSGALALARWLEALGYRVNRIDQATGPDPQEVLFLLAPVRRFERAEAEGLLDWVRRGGILVHVPSRAFPGPVGLAQAEGDGVLDGLEVGVKFGAYVEQATPSLPFFRSPPASRFLVKSGRYLELGSDTWTPLIQEDGRALAATRQLGAGRIYVIASESLFSNEAIAALDNEAMVLNILARTPGRRSVTFEEYHHSIIEQPDLVETMRTSPWGWALQYTALVGFLLLLWGGRRFGPPVVVYRVPARSGGDYVVSFAGLLQKARAVDWVQLQYAGLLRRRLARLLGVRHDLPAIDLARLLADRRPVDRATLAAHLGALDGPPLGQRALLREVRAVEQLLWSLEHTSTRGPA